MAPFETPGYTKTHREPKPQASPLFPCDRFSVFHDFLLLKVAGYGLASTGVAQWIEHQAAAVTVTGSTPHHAPPLDVVFMPFSNSLLINSICATNEVV